MMNCSLALHFCAYAPALDYPRPLQFPTLRKEQNTLAVPQDPAIHAKFQLQGTALLVESACSLPVSGSLVTAAVRPTPEEPLPVVGMARGAVQST